MGHDYLGRDAGTLVPNHPERARALHGWGLPGSFGRWLVWLFSVGYLLYEARFA